MTINFKDYDFVIHIETNVEFLVKRDDTSYNKWDSMLDEKVMCYPYSENQLILGEREYYRRELRRIWKQTIK